MAGVASSRAITRASRLFGASVSVIAIAVMAPSAFAQVADLAAADPQAVPAPAGTGVASTTSGATGVDAATAGTAPGSAGNTTGTSGASQDAGNPTPDTARDEIVVTGVRQSLATAQNIKRNSDTVVDAITAQDIGALPDRSVNEALQRIPGVAISRFAAPTDSAHFSVEGSGVVIRGLSYVRGEFNGRDTFAASGGREIGFNDVPAELIGSVEVFKNLTADLIEGGISGTVNINTRKPFDQEQRLVYLSGSMNYGDMAKRGAPSIVGLYSQQWDAPGGGRIGFLASGSYSEQNSRSDSVFISSYLPRYNDDTNGNGQQDAGEGRVLNAGTPYETKPALFDTYPVPAGRNMVYVPMGGGNRTQTFNRQRIGVSAAGQYENASRSVLLTAQYLRTDARQNWLEHTIEPSVGLSDSLLIKPVPGTTPTYDDNGVFTSGSLYKPGALQTFNGAVLPQFAPNGGPIVFANRYTEGQSVTQDFSFNAKLNPVEKLHINLDAQYVKSNANSVDDNVGTTSYGGFGIDVTGDTPKVTFQPDGRDPAAYFGNPSSQYFHDAMNNRTDNDGTEWAFRGDLQYDFSDGSFLRKVSVGGRYAKRDQTVRTNDYSNWGALSETWTSGGPVGLNTAPNETALFQYQDFYRNDSTQPPATNYISDAVLRDHDALTALLRRVAAAGGGTYVPLEDRTDLVDDYFRANEYYRNKETTWGGYARVDFGVGDFGNGMSLSGNIGVRFVRTKDESFGALTFPTQVQVINNFPTAAAFCGSIAPGSTIPAFCNLTAAQQSAVLGFSNGTSIPDTANQSFNFWLPSANVRLQATDKLQFRVAASKAISRPNFGDLRNYTGVTPGTSASGNAASSFGFVSQARNPFLRPVEAKQVDVTAEWYFAKVGSLTGALFYKQLSNIILDNYGYNRTLTNNGQTFDVLINGPANAPGKGNVKGAEVSYQQTFDFLPGVFSGLGAQATFTYVKPGHIPNGIPLNADQNNAPPVDTASLYSNLPLTGLSSYNYNLAAFYDKSNVYARFAYSWRSQFLLTNRDCCFPFLPVYALASGQMDGSVFLTVNKNFKIGLEGQNLLNSVTKTAYLLNADGLKAPRSSFISDRQITLTTRLTF